MINIHFHPISPYIHLVFARHTKGLKQTGFYTKQKHLLESAMTTYAKKKNNMSTSNIMYITLLRQNDVFGGVPVEVHYAYSPFNDDMTCIYPTTKRQRPTSHNFSLLLYALPYKTWL